MCTAQKALRPESMLPLPGVSGTQRSNIEIIVKQILEAKGMTHLVLARWASAWLCGKLARPEPLRRFLWRTWPWLPSFDPSPRLLYSVNGPLGSKLAKPAHFGCDLELQTKVSNMLLACRNMTSLKLYPEVHWVRYWYTYSNACYNKGQGQQLLRHCMHSCWINLTWKGVTPASAS